MQLITDLLRVLAGPARPATPTMSEHSEFLDYAERESRRTLDELRTAFNAHFERASKVLTLLTGGAGAVAAYAINNWDRHPIPAQLALLVLALGWGMAAIYLAVRGMRGRSLGAGAMVTALAQTYTEHAGSLMQRESAEKAANALRLVRMAELNREFLQTQAYSLAVSQQTKDLRRVVTIAAFTPTIAMMVWGCAVAVL
ncbi:hypothetical protein M4R22_10920 [Acidovorax sp. GBBC 3334]|uniref:hypothetical protein n=1 Tax=Acidovorax sp. GBBC 3334 TaxID=2940496 RepID=UPI002302345C|nr:hypothetical protein [Acidovorax sp. GBBC 3334]MDA8455273.1 hypothetical protein [Acidovorax sp. GBBC 3334]